MQLGQLHGHVAHSVRYTCYIYPLACSLTHVAVEQQTVCGGEQNTGVCACLSDQHVASQCDGLTLHHRYWAKHLHAIVMLNTIEPMSSAS